MIGDFSASADIKAFGRTYLFAMLLLIGLALFDTQGFVKQLHAAFFTNESDESSWFMNVSYIYVV